MNDFFLHIVRTRYIYFSNLFLFVRPSRDLWNYFTTRVERDLNMMSEHP